MNTTLANETPPDPARVKPVHWMLFALSLLALVSGHALASEIQEWLHEHCSSVIILLFTGLVFFKAAAAAHESRFHHHSAKWPLLLAAFFGDLFALEAHHAAGLPGAAVIFLAPLILFPALSILHEQRRALTGIHTLRRQRAVEFVREHPLNPLKALILFVSPPTAGVPKLGADAAPHHAQFRCQKEGKLSEWIPLKGGSRASLAKDIEQMDLIGRNHPWQQLLRAFVPHESLTHVWLFTSPPDRSSAARQPAGEVAFMNAGSNLYLDQCKEFLRPYLPPTANFCDIQAVDFEDSDSLQKLLRKIIHEELKGVSHDAVAIDVTGGQKTNSIIGGAVTLEDEVLIQYVQTAPRPEHLPAGAALTASPSPAELEPFIYDIRRDAPHDL